MFLTISSRGFNRLSVQRAIRITRNKLKLIRNISDKGLIIFCGCIRSNNGTDEQEICELLTPPIPVPTNYYKCDSKFHTEMVIDLFNIHKTYGYVIVTSVRCLIMLVKGTEKKIVYRSDTDLQTDSRRGGYSANRFARIRNEKRVGYKNKIIDQCLRHFQKVDAIICAGNAELPVEVYNQLKDDSRLDKPMLGCIKISTDTSIDEIILKSEILINTRDIQHEKKIIEEIEHYLRTNSDILVFSRDNIERYDQECLLRYVVVNEDIKLKNTEIKRINYLSFLNNYGGIIGVLYYPLTE